MFESVDQLRDLMLRDLAASDAGDKDMSDWRVRIDLVDQALIHLLNVRAGFALEIGKIKRKKGLPVYHPAREEAVLANVMKANPGPLSDLAVRRLYERVIDEVRSLERSHYHDTDEPTPE